MNLKGELNMLLFLVTLATVCAMGTGVAQANPGPPEDSAEAVPKHNDDPPGVEWAATDANHDGLPESILFNFPNPQIGGRTVTVAQGGQVTFSASDINPATTLPWGVPAQPVTVIIGTPAANIIAEPQLNNASIIFGGPGADQITGGAGSDYIEGGEGDDDIDGGPGPDRIRAGSGGDHVDGGDGDDFVFGGSGNDDLSGGHGDDSIFGDDGDDKLRGENPYGDPGDGTGGEDGDDGLHGGDGDDTIFGTGGGEDYFSGGVGEDHFVDPDGDDDDTYVTNDDGDEEDTVGANPGDETHPGTNDQYFWY